MLLLLLLCRQCNMLLFTAELQLSCLQGRVCWLHILLKNCLLLLLLLFRRLHLNI
jgi:hypothetical protein